MSFEREIKYYSLFKQQTAVGISAPVDVRDFKCAQIAAIGSNTAVFTGKVKASLQQEPPDFTKAAAVNNQWAYVQFVDLDTGNFADNFVFAANASKQFELNTNGMAWFAFEVSAYTSGTLDAQATITSNI